MKTLSPLSERSMLPSSNTKADDLQLAFALDLSHLEKNPFI